MEKGHEITYNWVKNLLRNCDFSDSSKRLGLKQISENQVLINFFDRTYKTTKDDMELIEQKTIWNIDSESYEYNLRSVLGYYVLSKANIEPAHEYSTLGHFSGGVFRESSSWFSNEPPRRRAAGYLVGVVLIGAESRSGAEVYNIVWFIQNLCKHCLTWA
jgi:hypothetical protein